jgi:MFS family permease
MVNGLIMATAPLLAVLMLGQLGFAPWQYGLAFGLPCVGGVIGARLARPLIARFGERKVMRAAGCLRACWSIGLAFIQPGIAGLALVIAIQFGLVTSIGVFNPVLATYRLQHTEADRIARVLSAWSVTSNATIAVLTALWGLLAGLTGPRIAIAIAGLLMLLSPFLLPREVGHQSRSGWRNNWDDRRVLAGFLHGCRAQKTRAMMLRQSVHHGVTPIDYLKTSGSIPRRPDRSISEIPSS